VLAAGLAVALAVVAAAVAAAVVTKTSWQPALRGTRTHGT